MSRRLYRLALLAFPRLHRELYGAEMIEAFDRLCAARRSAGAWALFTFVAAACTDAVAAGIVERRRRHVVRFGYAFAAIDFTLGWRMLRRYPGLSIVGAFGMAVGITVAAGAFNVSSAVMSARLPLPQGERIVSLISTDAATRQREGRLVRDFQDWRAMTTVEDLGITRSVSPNLIVEGRPPEPVVVAEISASAFRVAGVPAWRGRYLLPEDEAASAAGALVIGFDEWVRRFNSDPGIIGRQVQLGGADYAIVGVMPEEFGFPVNHSFWIPWRVDPSAYQWRSGPSVNIFGRLAAGATLEAAQAELTAIGQRAAAESPATHQHLRSRVLPYTHAFNDMDDPENAITMRGIQVSMALLLFVVCVNIAILVYARTATRQGEIAVRTALGASRRRIVAQLVVEAFTLSSVAAAAGVFFLSIAMSQFEAAVVAIGMQLPFWMSFRLSADTVIYIVGLTLLASAIVGVLPALKVTGAGVNAGLQTLSAGSGSRMQMGRLWTLLIVTQVAMTVAMLPVAVLQTWTGLRVETGDPGFASAQFVTATIAIDRSFEPSTPAGDAAARLRYAADQADLEQRLRAEPGVIDVTSFLVDPGEELAMVLQTEGEAYGSRDGVLARYNRVAVNFFDAFEVPVLLGRDFVPADAGTDRVIVNRAMAEGAFGSANPLGRRVKYTGRSREAGADDAPLEQWFEIVGVVPQFPLDDVVPDPVVYHPAGAGDLAAARVAVRVLASDPATFADRLREIAVAVNPNLQVRNVSTNAILAQREQGLFRMIAATVGLVITSVIVLSAAGIYALMSFTVSRRRREIGIRAALGAGRNQLLLGIFSRALLQLGCGAALGMAGSLAVERMFSGEGEHLIADHALVVLPLVALVMMTVGALAAIGPARQGLRIQPTEALREE